MKIYSHILARRLDETHNFKLSTIREETFEVLYNQLVDHLEAQDDDISYLNNIT